MNYIELDVNNLTKWFKGFHRRQRQERRKRHRLRGLLLRPPRRSQRPNPGRKTGAYGYNDNVNPNDAANGCPNGILEPARTMTGLARTNKVVNYANVPNPLVNNAGTGISLNAQR